MPRSGPFRIWELKLRRSVFSRPDRRQCFLVARDARPGSAGHARDGSCAASDQPVALSTLDRSHGCQRGCQWDAQAMGLRRKLTAERQPAWLPVAINRPLD